MYIVHGIEYTCSLARNAAPPATDKGRVVLALHNNAPRPPKFFEYLGRMRSKCSQESAEYSVLKTDPVCHGKPCYTDNSTAHSGLIWSRL